MREKIMKSDLLKTLVSTFVTIIIGVFISFLVMLLIEPGSAFDGLRVLFTEGFSDFSKVIRKSAPIIFTGLSVAFAFRTGLFNIGATGQFTVGGLAAIYVGVAWDLPYPIHWFVAALAGAFVGFLWGLIPGILKSYRNVHEVVATIMLNYIAVAFTVFAVKTSTLFNVGKGETKDILASAKSTGIAGFDTSIIFAIVAAVVIYIVLFKTKFGYELRAVGFSRSAAKYAGINEKRGMSLSMGIAGLLAGLGGALYFMSIDSPHLEPLYTLAPQGFDGISVALIGSSHPLGVIFSGLFIGFLRVGGEQLQGVGYGTEFVDIIVASIIYFVAFIQLIKLTIFKNRKKKKDNDDTALEGGTK